MAAIARGDQRRALIIAAAGFGLVLVLFAASRLLGGGGGGEPADTTAPAPSGGGAVPEPEDGQSTGEPVPVAVVPLPELPDSFEIAELRDPFTEPLRPILADLELSQLTGVPPDGGTQPGQPGGGGTVPAGVVLLGVQPDADGVVFASVEIDDEIFEAAEGEVFGPNDEFMAIDLDVTTQCGIFLFGDEPFSLCVGGQPQPGQPSEPGQPGDGGDAEIPQK